MIPDDNIARFDSSGYGRCAALLGVDGPWEASGCCIVTLVDRSRWAPCYTQALRRGNRPPFQVGVPVGWCSPGKTSDGPPCQRPRTQAVDPPVVAQGAPQGIVPGQFHPLLARTSESREHTLPSATPVVRGAKRGPPPAKRRAPGAADRSRERVGSAQIAAATHKLLQRASRWWGGSRLARLPCAD